MPTIGKAGPWIALAVVFLLGGSADAASPAQRCHEAQVKAQRKLETCLKKSAKEVTKGKPDRSGVCQAKYNVALSKKVVGPACHFNEHDEGSEDRAHLGDTY
jgi:hypothetical protein